MDLLTVTWLRARWQSKIAFGKSLGTCRMRRVLEDSAAANTCKCDRKNRLWLHYTSYGAVSRKTSDTCWQKRVLKQSKSRGLEHYKEILCPVAIWLALSFSCQVL